MSSTIQNGYGRKGDESINVCFCRGPHDLAIYAVKGKGYEVGTARQLAEWDVGFFFEDDLRSKGTAMVAESLVYLPGGNMLLTDREHNPILQFPEQAEYAFSHSLNPQFSCLFHPPQECVKQLEAIAQEDVDKAIAGGVLLLQMEKLGDYNNPINFADFKTNPVTRFLGWDKSEQLFGGRLHYEVDFNIKPKEERLKQKEAFAFPLIVHQLSPYWTLDGAGFYSFYKRIFGVQLQAEKK